MSTNNFWLETFGDVEYAYDFAGFRIKRSEYNNRRSNYGWNIDHLIPLSQNGLNSKLTAINNLITFDNTAQGLKFAIDSANVPENLRVNKAIDSILYMHIDCTWPIIFMTR